MNPNYILNHILNVIYTPTLDKLEERKNAFSVEQLFKRLSRESLDKYLSGDESSFLLEYGELNEVIEKLTKDGYLKSDKYYEVVSYYTTFEGRWFISNGGYVAEAELLDQEKSWQTFVETKTVENARYLNGLTFALVAVTAFLLVYQVWHDTNPVWSISFLTALFLFGSGTLVGLCIWLVGQEVFHRKNNK
jgi:hypothetical protein